MSVISMANNPEVAPGDGDAPGDVSMQQDNPLFVTDLAQKEDVSKVGPITSLEELPEVLKYLKRIDAKPVNFMRADG